MDDKNKGLEELANLKDFNERYSHYVETGEKEDEKFKEKEYEDIKSYSDGNQDFYSGHSDEETLTENETEAVEEEASPSEKKAETNENFFTKNKYRNTKIIALCLVIALLLTGAGFLIWLIMSTKGADYDNNGIEFADEIDEDYLVDDNHDFQVMGDIDANSLNGFLKQWATNGGEKMYSKNIINVLLCGVDSVNKLCDAQILVSVNKKTEQIKMISFLRDSWTYMNMPRSDGSSYDYYNKINAAYLGGPATLKETIENNYKIEIDEYIVVDFQSFPKLIDALGGVTVEVQKYETDYIRRTSRQKDFPYGEAKLNGTQTLIYSRIRKCDVDSDLSRTRRQRNVIKGLIESAKNATKGQLINAYKLSAKYIKTGYKQSEVLSLIATAYSHDWMDFEIKEITMPNEDYVDRVGGYIGSAWAWTVDYPLCAQKVQQEIYGQSNIILSADRTSPLDFVTNKRISSSTGSSSSSGSSSSGSSYTRSTRYYDDDEDQTYTRTRYYDDDETDTTSYTDGNNDEPTERTHFTLPTRATEEPKTQTPDPVTDAPEQQEPAESEE